MDKLSGDLSKYKASMFDLRVTVGQLDANLERGVAHMMSESRKGTAENRVGLVRSAEGDRSDTPPQGHA